jgi:hypothetical protein
VAIYPYEQILFLENYLCGQIFILTNVTIHIRTQKYLFTNPFLENYLCGHLSIRTNPFSGELSMWPDIHTNKCHHTCSLSKNTIYKSFSGELSMLPAIHTNKCHHTCSLSKILFTNPFSRELSMCPAIHTNKCHHIYSYPKISIYKSFSRELSMWPAINANKFHHTCSYPKIYIYKSFSSGRVSIRTNVTIHVRTQKYIFTNPFLVARYPYEQMSPYMFVPKNIYLQILFWGIMYVASYPI